MKSRKNEVGKKIFPYTLKNDLQNHFTPKKNDLQNRFTVSSGKALAI